MENEDGGGRENRRKSLRQSKNSGVVVGGSVSPRRSSRNRTTSPEDEATGMAKRLSKQPATEKDGCEEIAKRLPERLFATDRFPSERVNMYSTVDFLLGVRDVLRGTPEMELLLGSCFGGLFRTPALRLFAGKVVNSMMARQVVTKKSTRCGPFLVGNHCVSLLWSSVRLRIALWRVEDGYSFDYQLQAKDDNYEFWGRLIGRNRNATVEDLMAMVESDPQMSGEKKLKLCLIVIVDGVLVATLQKPKPTLKYVKLLENLDEFFDFPWGRESFMWTLSTLKPPPKVFGKLEDPLVKTVGFPLALQLVAFRCVPRLASFVGGDDSVTIMDYPEKAMPLHAGLSVAHIRKAEHDPLLIVEPMMEISGDHDDRWGLWADETYDKKVDYMVQLLKNDHIFVKENWLGGDALDPLFVYEEKPKTRKRKKNVAAEPEPIRKQRRISGVFRRGGSNSVDPEKFAALEGRVNECFVEVGKLRSVCEQQGRTIKILNRRLKASIQKKYRRSAIKVRGADEKRQAVNKEPDATSSLAAENNADCSGDFDHTEGGNLDDFSGPDDQRGVVEAEDAENATVAATTEGISQVEQGCLDVLVGAVIRDVVDKVVAEVPAPAPVIMVRGRMCEVYIVLVASIPAGGLTGKPVGVSAALPLVEKIDVDTKSDQEQAVMPNSAGPSNIVVREDEIGSGDDLTDEDAAEAKEGCRTVVLSDSPTELAPKHVPVADEEELAALLLAKSPIALQEMVPLIEDVDYPFLRGFYRSIRKRTIFVKFMHLDAGGRDLDNEFFLQLATPGVWVNSTHMEVLMEYSERRYGLGVHLERGMFVAPWFTAHMQGKGRSFKAARRKTGVAGDAKITNYLTRPRQRWGMEVDRLYTPMIWGGTHWVGLCISLSDWAIYVFDPNPLGKTMEQVEELLEPVSTMLPYVAKKVCPAEAVGKRAQVPFRVERVTGLYVNRRSGDCGPVAVKFLEMHATGDRKPNMAGLTDDLVDIFRKHYAMDIYRGVVVPLYLR
ncbi:hypothetical protein Bca52824_080496 [Brassica carinata]|uniref:Ubiquitin-like protease family profile domain-containing protein n=1 Tax=Brassica carinata TaxID=52824 RepID=A0A8X7PFL3_BRACI|nr:hypothetical protein Bca52824_080496 [Brassica carinata]